MHDDPRHLSGRTADTDPRRPDETWESIPWDSLLQADQGRRRWVAYVAIALAVSVAGAAAAVVLRDQPPPAVEAVATPPTPSTESVVVSTVVDPATPATETTDDDDTAWLTEADLMAAPTAIETEAEGAAAWFLFDFLTRDVGPDRPAGVHVESIVVLATRRVESDTTTVRMAARTLGTTDGTTWTRRPDAVYEVLVTTSPDGPIVSGVPILLEGPMVTVEEPDETVEVSAARSREAIRGLSRWGDVDHASLVSYATPAGHVVVADVTDEAGLAWRVGFLVGETSAAG